MKKLAKDTKLMALGAMLFLVVPCVSGLVLASVGMWAFDVEMHDATKTGDRPPTVTLAEFEQLQEGMSHQEVVAIVGDPGVEAAPEAGDGDGRFSVSVWLNSDSSYMNATFENGQLVAKTHLYLK